MQETFFSDPISVMAVIIMVPVFFVWLEKTTKWKLFDYLPPIVWIFIAPVLLSNLNVIPKSTPIYSTFKSFAVPLFIVLMLLDINIREALKVAWRSAFVMVIGSLGVVVGGVIAFYLFKNGLAHDAWSGFGALAGSWIGGMGNLAAVAESLNTSPESVGIVVLVDTVVCIVYIPVILMAKRWASRFNRFTKVSEEQMRHFSNVAAKIEKKAHEVHFKDILTLFGIGFTCILVANWISKLLPPLPPVFTTKTWAMLLITSFGILLSTTRLKKVPGTEPIAMSLVYIYMAMIGAMADLSNMDGAIWFLLAGVLCMIIHFIFVILSARLFKVDIGMAAVASVAAVGGAASAPVIAAYYREELVPVSILLALIGYALGNYLGVATAYLCHLFV